MKKDNRPKSNDQKKILRWISRNEQFERNGGGQFVSMNHTFKDKTKYDRKDKKKELRKDLSSYFFWNYIPVDARKGIYRNIYLVIWL